MLKLCMRSVSNDLWPNDQPSLTLFIRGRLADGRWYEETLEMSAASAANSQSCLRALWGKQRVRELEDKMFRVR